MKYIFRTFIFLLVTLICFQFGLSQNDSLVASKDSISIKQDSINAVYFARLQEIEKQRIEDSIKKAELEEQINSLKTTDNLKKEELQQQLLALNEKEANRLAQKKEQIDQLRTTAKPFPVNGFFSDTLFLIYGKLGSFSASERAEAIERRVKELSEESNFNPEQLLVKESEGIFDIIYGESTIASITEADAIWSNTTGIELASNYKTIISESILEYQTETSIAQLGKEIGLALVVILILVLLIYYIIKLFKWIETKIKEQEGKKITGFKIRSYTLFNEKQLTAVLIWLNSLVKWVVIILLLYLALPILFGIFPWTKNLADTLFGYIFTPAKKIGISIWKFLPNLFTIIVILVIFRYAIKGIAFLKKEIEKGNLKIDGFYKDWANPTFQIVKVLLYAFMLVVIFPYLPGSDSPVFQGVSVFLGVLFTFGSSGSLSNVVAGLVLTYMRAFKIGDRVKIGDITGDIIEKSLLVTRIRTIKNEIISIPNSNVMSAHTINYSSDAPEKGLIMHTTVTIGYDVPWKKMHETLILAALRTEMLLDEPKPFVLQTSLDDFYVSYQLNAYTREPNKQAVIYSDLHQNIQDCCNEAGIEILSPHYRAARDGNMVTIPGDYLPKDYKAPSFNVKVEKDDPGK